MDPWYLERACPLQIFQFGDQLSDDQAAAADPCFGTGHGKDPLGHGCNRQGVEVSVRVHGVDHQPDPIGL